MYPLAASSGFETFTLFDELLAVPYGVRSIKNGSGLPSLSDPAGRRITTCSFTPSRIGTIASLCVYSFDGAFCSVSWALDPVTGTRRLTERPSLQHLRTHHIRRVPRDEIKLANLEISNQPSDEAAASDILL